MRISRTYFVRGAALVALAILAFLPVRAASQDRAIVGKQIALDSDEASLSLAFGNGSDLDVVLRDGSVFIRDDDVGSYEPGGSFEQAWRELLGDAVSLENGPLRRALTAWAPPSDLSGGERVLAARVDQVIERALERASEGQEDVAVDFGFGSISIQGDLISALLGQTDRLAALADAFEGIDVDNLQVQVGEDVLIERGSTLDATLLVIDGDVEIEGELDGDLVMVGGDFWVSRGGRVTGDVRLADTRVRLLDGDIRGEVIEIDSERRNAEFELAEVRERLRDEIRMDVERELEAELAAVEQRESRSRSMVSGAFRAVTGGVSGLVENLVRLLVLGMIGCAVVFFAGSNLEVVAETASRNPVRAAAVGLAGAFLAIPVWGLGAVALAISLIGIPVLAAWLPLFPLAVVAGAGLGLFAVAANVGDLLGRQQYPYLRWIRASNPYTLVVGGLVGLTIPFMLANVVQMAGSSLGFLQSLLSMAGWLILMWLSAVGFGSVILTRAGRRPEFYAGDPLDDIDWSDLGRTDPATDGDWFGGESSNTDETEPGDVS